MQLLDFIRYLYRSQKNKLFIAIFLIVLIAIRLVSLGVDAKTFLGFVLGLAFLILMGRQKILRTLVLLVGIPCILFAMISGYHPPEGYQSSITGFVAGGVIMLLFREYAQYRKNI
ncbi:hypothetical protein OND84_004244 [Morganella morganii]|uniref:hypothetical protein n=1 Tax=Providencia huaxiensis TaxID=2027290 RepID=UPI002ADE997A|nr:hypothetical protein [Morganella morganii]EMB6212842.1 hypothetical protein [Morganella morganii]